jgi:hypothetical protein
LKLLGLHLQRLAALLKCEVGRGVELEATPAEISGNIGR